MMLDALFDLARPCLFTLDGERAHELTLRSLQAGIYPRLKNDLRPEIAVKLWGLDFPNPLGIAAGFDKNACVPDAVLAMGMGYTEVGTVTPRAQAGNPKPRIFRMVDERALINRLGFNNGGHAGAHQRLRQCAHRGVIGVNIGANKTSQDRVQDYVDGLRTFYDVADYFMINISSPNTPGLRDLQAPALLDELLDRIMEARDTLINTGAPARPVIVKLSPDIDEGDMPAVVERLESYNVDGIAVSNTTLTRPGLEHTPLSEQAGGLSGSPLFHISTVILARVYELTGGRIPLVGIGGIDSGETALAKILAGASLLQLYTGLVFAGPGLIEKVQLKLCEYVQSKNLSSITQAVGSQAKQWAAKPLIS